MPRQRTPGKELQRIARGSQRGQSDAAPVQPGERKPERHDETREADQANWRKSRQVRPRPFNERGDEQDHDRAGVKDDDRKSDRNELQRREVADRNHRGRDDLKKKRRPRGRRNRELLALQNRKAAERENDEGRAEQSALDQQARHSRRRRARRRSQAVQRSGDDRVQDGRPRAIHDYEHLLDRGPAHSPAETMSRPLAARNVAKSSSMAKRAPSRREEGRPGIGVSTAASSNR